MLDYRSARLALAEAEERCNQLHQVEKQLYELRDLFVDLAILIEHQVSRNINVLKNLIY